MMDRREQALMDPTVGLQGRFNVELAFDGARLNGYTPQPQDFSP